MIKSSCLCQKNATFFQEAIVYKNETVFSKYEGIMIAQCKNCGVLKTITSKESFNPAQSRSDFYEENRQKFIGFFLPIVAKIKQYCKKGLILDVGCSSGVLLSLLKKEGYEAYGIEPNHKAYESAKAKFGAKIAYGTLKDFVNGNKKKFDCVIYNHVLEHIEGVNNEIALTRNSLKKGGLLVIGVPNTANIIFTLRKKYWESLMPDEHIWHFSAKYLTMLLKTYGFKIIDVAYSDHQREDYPWLKKLYFKTLSLMNKFLNTGESALIYAIK